MAGVTWSFKNCKGFKCHQTFCWLKKKSHFDKHKHLGIMLKLNLMLFRIFESRIAHNSMYFYLANSSSNRNSGMWRLEIRLLLKFFLNEIFSVVFFFVKYMENSSLAEVFTKLRHNLEVSDLLIDKTPQKFLRWNGLYLR